MCSLAMRFDHLLVGSTGLAGAPPAAEIRLGLRTAVAKIHT